MLGLAHSRGAADWRENKTALGHVDIKFGHYCTLDTRPGLDAVTMPTARGRRGCIHISLADSHSQISPKVYGQRALTPIGLPQHRPVHCAERFSALPGVRNTPFGKSLLGSSVPQREYQHVSITERSQNARVCSIKGRSNSMSVGMKMSRVVVDTDCTWPGTVPGSHQRAAA